MKAELMLFGKSINMAPRSRRRILVVMIYLVLSGWIVSSWYIDHWRTTSAYLLFATIYVNQFLLGGYGVAGLIKSFTGKAPRTSDQPPPIPFLLLGLRTWQIPADDRRWRNDERETQQRDRAHYLAYQWVTFSLLLLWLLEDSRVRLSHRLTWMTQVDFDHAMFGVVMAAIVLALTLPQVILLWTEPDMESDREPELQEA